MADAARRPFGPNESLAGGNLDARTGAIVRIAALIGLGAPAASYQWSVEAAGDAGVTADEVLGVLLSVAPRVGLARLVSAITPLALAIGYNIDAAFEGIDPSR